MTAAVYLLPRLCRDIGSSVTEELFDVLSHAYAGEHSFGTDEICITNWPLVPDNSSCFRLFFFFVCFVVGSSRKDQPSFTLRQVSYLCERLLKDHEEKIREEYEQILNTKLAGKSHRLHS